MSLQRPEILLIEHQRPLVAGLLRMLDGNALDVMLAVNGEDGYRKACDGQPDLILLNADLPDAAGLDLLRGLHSALATAQIPVVVGSGRRAAHCRSAAYALGAVDYVLKPYRRKALISRLFVHLRPELWSGSASMLTDAIAALHSCALVWPGNAILARQLGCSEAELMHSFERRFSLTPEVFHTQLCLEWTRLQLYGGGAVEDVALAWNSSLAGEWPSLFFQHYGLSPGAYRDLF